MKKNEASSDNHFPGMPIGMCIGLSIGVAIGSAMGNVGVGMCMGLGIGLCFGSAYDAMNRKKSQEKQEDEQAEKD